MDFVAFLPKKVLECKNSVRMRTLYKTGDTVSARSNLNRVSVFFFFLEEGRGFIFYSKSFRKLPDTGRVRDELEVSAETSKLPFSSLLKTIFLRTTRKSPRAYSSRKRGHDSEITRTDGRV